MQKSFKGAMPKITRYTLGTMGMTDRNNPDHVKTARAGMEAGIWFHSSADYPGVSEVLKIAFREDPAHVPRLILKTDGKGPDKLKATVENQVRDLGIGKIDIAQVCGEPDVDKSFRPGCALHEMMCDLKRRGLVGNFVLENWRWTSDEALKAVRDDLFDAHTFYWNATERQASNALFDMMRARHTKILALRTLGGGTCNRDPDLPEERVQAIHAIYQRSGCASQVEFRLRFILSQPNVLTTIGGASKVERLNLYLEAERNFRPLDGKIIAEIDALHRQWYAAGAR
ncbi:MAG: hypothetical protein FJ225_07360 [Lentisphaerae bacterium]|nr:hypothetical protein [Lentisphaerota bacterium]